MQTMLDIYPKNGPASDRLHVRCTFTYEPSERATRTSSLSMRRPMTVATWPQRGWRPVTSLST